MSPETEINLDRHRKPSTPYWFRSRATSLPGPRPKAAMHQLPLTLRSVDAVSFPACLGLWKSNAFFPRKKWPMAGDEESPEKLESALALAESLRVTVGNFVRGIRANTNTPTTSQSETLALLDRSGPLSVAELASRRNVRHQSMRLVAGQLETAELVSKLPNPVDSRSRLLSITEKGREELTRSRKARTAEIAALIDERLSQEDRRTLEAAIRIIERLVRP
ncbi:MULTISPECIES: MarR family transcriptional regulator [Rhizobium]|uniref:MarR family winged helix-turn-helix transcriptional regulator n=1 Tax=Rhizobium TaxID=379 RepID=UPI001B3421F8|nr:MULTISPECIES: MarR family transcriptional regulator [Rhizobium]MBX4912025.1 MarR family transcriptional regulator [Rhizobium bangladeshense]MBX5236636.1 MarR family transcriptional regulator [Rhizobium sp. NLR4a]MBX5254846.1 MarR family transcriptional regulator [Rhizobium sp. NLR4b]MBX5260960.1 MarR family transcriptional regulator [Rhizobium sp. NLR16b]MBX5267049.1 MarR family transcriptional regulator [Rhizobium sp. NLR16a]